MPVTWKTWLIFILTLSLNIKYTKFMKYNLIISILIIIAFVLNSCRKSDYETPAGPQVIRDNGGGTGTATWTKDKDYLIEGLVFVNDGQSLTIEPGTVIRFKTGQGSAASALIIARGGRIYAEGSESEPIVMTAEGDDMSGSIPLDATGLWGGLIILGNARLNLSSGEAHVEGIPVYEPRGVYGGYNDDDNSGVLRYISIRHGGTNIGDGNEINGLTLAAVGNQTVIDHIEVISNTDDGIEIFGGTVDLKYISVAFCGDDAYDFDLGYRGRMQFILGIQYFSRGDKILEIDGGSDPVQGKPYSYPSVFNGTFIGRGQADLEIAASFGRNAGGILGNSIVIHQHHGIEIEYVDGIESSFQQFLNGKLAFSGNIFHDLEGNDPDSMLTVTAAAGVDIQEQQQVLSAYFTPNGNSVSDPGIDISNGYFDVFPQGNIYDNLAPLPDEWFDETSFKGAFYTYSWVEGWTLLNQAGFVP
jgi:hypothetical protein